MKIVDTKGQLCPAPIIAAKKALREVSRGETFLILTDNQTSLNNLLRFLKDNNAGCKVDGPDGDWKLTVTKTVELPSGASPEEYCETQVSHFEKGNFIVVVSSDKMGEGDPDLGTLLIQNFIKALKDIDKLPDKILFYNSGVKLATYDSPVIDHLRDLEKMGVEIILCGTCVNHYSLASEIRTGSIGNMFTIVEIMSKAGNIIKP